MTAAKVPASQDGPAMSVAPRQPRMVRRMPAWPGRDVIGRGEDGTGPRGTLPGTALRGLGFGVAHNGTRLMA
jgi:hypothetical protein